MALFPCQLLPSERVYSRGGKSVHGKAEQERHRRDSNENKGEAAMRLDMGMVFR